MFLASDSSSIIVVSCGPAAKVQFNAHTWHMKINNGQRVRAEKTVSHGRTRLASAIHRERGAAVNS